MDVKYKNIFKNEHTSSNFYILKTAKISNVDNDVIQYLI